MFSRCPIGATIFGLRRRPGRRSLALCCLLSGAGLYGWGTSAVSALADERRPDGFAATRVRPLFSVTRRPPAPATAATMPIVAPPPPAAPPNVALSGVIIGGGKKIAIVRRPNDPAALSVALGTQIDGWVVVEVRAREIVLRQGDRSATIGLPDPGR